ncbi:MAG: polysaccharide deacetylase family protein [Candidatus Zambryskibacteria bacterium]|nr:polysaccharide deacetylase family protein [Candidatus Zambryskibacteria bacterium]
MFRKKLKLLLIVAIIALSFSVWENINTAQTPIVQNNGPKKMIALTFDDGPYGVATDQILQILKEKKVVATFFLIGRNVEKHPAQVKKIIDFGNVVGNHSYSHSRELPTESIGLLQQDIALAQALITDSSGGFAPHLFRAPYGAVSPQMTQEIENEGYIFVKWDVDPRDWDNKNTTTNIIDTILSKAKPNDILLFHDGHEEGSIYARENTTKALPIIIDALRSQGYTFVTVDKIFHTNPYK